VRVNKGCVFRELPDAVSGLVHFYIMQIAHSHEPKLLPVVDLFAGPGGLGEGFSALDHESVRFDVVLSVEKDAAAHRTLRLRSLFRHLRTDYERTAYYLYLKGEISSEDLFAACPDAANEAETRCLHLELGSQKTKRVYARLDRLVGATEPWVLVGGPPCQAYSVVGRSRLAKLEREKFEENDKHTLYREYLRIIARYKPAVFVMENVKGLLSAEYGGNSTFKRIISDLSSPAVAVRQSPNGRSPLTRRGGDYDIYSIAHSPGDKLLPEHYVIPAEKFGIPQKRHRVILLGIRSDLTVPHSIALKPSPGPSVCDVISDLPPLRSRLSKEDDDAEAWADAIRRLMHNLRSHDLPDSILGTMTGALGCLKSGAGIGGRSVPKCQGRRLPPTELTDWLIDPAMDFVVNHETRRHMKEDLLRYLFASSYAIVNGRSPKLHQYPAALLPHHVNVAHTVEHRHGFFNDRFRVQVSSQPATTVTSHICKDGHYFIHHDPAQCRCWTVREAARVQTFPDNYFFEGTRTDQYRQVGNAVPPYLALQVAEVVATVLAAQ
jgi:DNA (cytosine-5)-methyltransferase 1